MFYFIVTNQYINTQMITSTGGGCCNFLNSILDSDEVWASQVEPVKPAKCSESSNPAHDTAKLSLVAGSWLFHDEDDDDANFGSWDCLQRSEGVFQDLSQQSRECKYVTTTSPCSRRLRLSKFSGSNGPPGMMCAQFRLIIKYVAGLPGCTGSPESSMLID